ncbi:MAG: DedA family protein [Planctomycetes bacterium]|nr:DedA family protein [Planctomycetota bacterium]
MRMLLAATFLLAITDGNIYAWLEAAFYPALLLIFIIASLGIPIPEDIPLIAAGVILKTSPHVATWPGAIAVSLLGIMSGDMILYNLGRRWGPNVFSHRSVAWLITPKRMTIMTERFHEYGTWACFFGRFMVGVRAMMCLTAGVTRFPFWKFFIADFCGALLSVPFFIGLGYFFANMLDSLKEWIADVQTTLGAIIGLVVVGIVWFEFRRLKKIRQADLAEPAGAAAESAPAATPPSTPVASHPAEPRRKPNTLEAGAKV